MTIIIGKPFIKDLSRNRPALISNFTIPDYPAQRAESNLNQRWKIRAKTNTVWKFIPQKSQIIKIWNPSKSKFDRLKRWKIPLFCSTPLPLRSTLLTKMYAPFINTSFFAARLRHKNSAVVARWSHTLKVCGSNPGISSKFPFLMIFPKFWVSRISIFGHFIPQIYLV